MDDKINNPQKYSKRYFKRHLVQYKKWENNIGEYIVKILKAKSIIDFGCGVGSFLEGAYNYNCKKILGIELNLPAAKKYIPKNILPFIIQKDITSPIELNEKFDFGISFEVAEHIDPEKSKNFINNLTNYSNKYIILTAAPPGQGGTNHINLRKKIFWMNLIQKRGFKYEKKLVEQCKKDWEKFETPEYILKNLMIFKREKI